MMSGSCEHGVVMAAILSKLPIVLRRMLDALADAWIRQAASEAERTKPRSTERL
jgi:hypothetical protein